MVSQLLPRAPVSYTHLVDPVHAFGTLGHFNIGQPLRAVDLHKVAVFVNQLVGQRSPARDAQDVYKRQM